MAIKLGQQQLEMLRPSVFDRYIEELIVHCQKYYPKLIQRIPEEALKPILIEVVNEAESERIDQRGPVRFYVDLQILFGSGFKTDPQYQWISQWLTENADYSQLEQADFLYFKCMEYFEAIYGENNIYKYMAGNMLEQFDLNHYNILRESFDTDMLAILKDIYPKKAELATDEALLNLINQAKQIAMNQYLYSQIDQVAYFIINSYLYGHQFTSDPFLPNINVAVNTFNEANDYIDNKNEINQYLKNQAQQWVELCI